MAETVSRGPRTVKTWVQMQASPCGVCGEQSDSGTVFFLLEYFGITRSVSFHQCSILHAFIDHRLCVILGIDSFVKYSLKILGVSVFCIVQYILNILNYIKLIL